MFTIFAYHLCQWYLSLCYLGDYIVFLDGDDWLETDSCEKLATMAQETGADIIQYGLTVETPDQNSPEAQWFDAWFNVKTDHVDGGEEMLKRCYADRQIPWNIATKAIRTELFKQAVACQQEYRINALEDFVTCFFVFFFAKTWHRLDARLYHYRFGTGMSTKSTVSVKDLRADLQAFKGLNSIKRFVAAPENHASALVKDIVDNHISGHLSEHFFNFIFVRMDNQCNPLEWADAFAEEAGSDVALHILASRIAVRREVMVALERNVGEKGKRVKELEQLLEEKESLLQQTNRDYEWSQQRIHKLRRLAAKLRIALIVVSVILVLAVLVGLYNML